MQGPVYLIGGGTYVRTFAATATLLFRDSVKANSGLFSTMLKILSLVMLLPAKMWFNHISHAPHKRQQLMLFFKDNGL